MVPYIGSTEAKESRSVKVKPQRQAKASGTDHLCGLRHLDFGVRISALALVPICQF